MDKLEDRKVLREAAGRQLHREGLITVKDLDLTIVVLAQGTMEVRMTPVYPKNEEDLEMWRRR